MAIKIILANPRGFCAGVDRAINIVELTLKHFNPPIYVKHEIVHNKRIVADLKQKGIIFVDSMEEIPNNATAIFSAHGSPKDHYQIAVKKNIQLIDATCPLVSKVHKIANDYNVKNKEIIMIGHKKHVEVIGTTGNVEQNIQVVENVDDVNNLIVNNPKNLAFVTQTTLSLDDTKDIIDALREKFPNIEGGESGSGNTCYATQNRQDAVKQMIEKNIKLLLVLGSQNSSNSNRLKEIGIKHNIDSFLIDGISDINDNWFDNVNVVGITAGASAHEKFVQEAIEYIKSKFNAEVENMEGIEETVIFYPPKILRDLEK